MMIAKKYLGTGHVRTMTSTARHTSKQPRDQDLNVETTRVDRRTGVGRYTECEQDHDESACTFVTDHCEQQICNTDRRAFGPIGV